MRENNDLWISAALLVLVAFLVIGLSGCSWLKAGVSDYELESPQGHKVSIYNSKDVGTVSARAEYVTTPDGKTEVVISLDESDVRATEPIDVSGDTVEAVTPEVRGALETLINALTQ